MNTSCTVGGENAVMRLKSLYERFGYRKFKMSKFEEYDLYAENKSFLKTENLITFSDLNGRLLALKPDVTLSIVKNVRGEAQLPYKLYYNENVYRVARGTKDYREITQVGLEYIGEVDLYSAFEVLLLAEKSLAAVSESYILDVSHLGFIGGLLDETSLLPQQRERICELISERNAHELKTLCAAYGTDGAQTERICKLAAIYGAFEKVLPEAEALVQNDTMQKALDELKSLYALMKDNGAGSCINLDFSIVNDVSYYNGVIFQGFIEGVPAVALSGGRYDNLLKKLGKNAEAIGFAVYTDIFDSYFTPETPYDVDCVLLYGDCGDAGAIARAAASLAAGGRSIRVQREWPKELAGADYYTLRNGEVTRLDADS